VPSALDLQPLEALGAKKKFCEAQEATRKDVEHAFGALQSCFAIVRVQLEYGMGTQKETL
jgi:hypothetical protein